MDKFERRRIRLLELIQSMSDGKIVAFAEKIGREQSYVSRMLYPKGKQNKKNIGEDMVAHIEETLNLPKGWFDRSDENIWPFASFTIKEYMLLDNRDKEEVELLIRLKINRMKLKQEEEKKTA